MTTLQRSPAGTTSLDTSTIQNFIAGEFVAPASGEYMANVEPATGKTYSRVPDSDATDVEQAVIAARAAFSEWSRTPPEDRSQIMTRVAELIERDADRLAEAESIDNGKPVSLARTVDIPRAAKNFRFFATAILHYSTHLHEIPPGGKMPPGTVGGGSGALNYILRRPRGVAGSISPWNLPLYLLTWKLAPAMATGNTCVAKPSELTPMTAYLLCELLNEAGVPGGVVNIVHGLGPKAGSAIVDHPQVPTLSFTGSTDVGRWIASEGAKRTKRVSLEMGGKNPFVVFEDAEMDEVITMGARAAFANQGQICLCGSRAIVHRKVHDEFLKGMIEAAEGLKAGDPLDPETRHGAQIGEHHIEKIQKYVDLATELGGTIHCGGERVPQSELPERCKGGAFYRPTVITGVPNDCPVIQEEIFGPVVTIQSFEDEGQAVELANSTEYGLSASLWTQDVSRAHRVANLIEAGVVWINCWMLRDLRTPYGGMKQSGLEREGGFDAIEFHTEPKNVCLKI